MRCNPSFCNELIEGLLVIGGYLLAFVNDFFLFWFMIGGFANTGPITRP